MSVIRLTVKPKELTFDQVLRGQFGVTPKTPTQAEQNFEACVKLALTLKDNLKANRMAIAEIAKRSCLVKHGGDVKTEAFKTYFKKHTLKHFADKVGINHHTLSRWIIIKDEIFDHLPEKEKTSFNLRAGDYASRHFRKLRKKDKDQKASAQEILDLYREHKESTRTRDQRDAMSYLSRAVFLLVKRKAIYRVEEFELAKISELSKKILSEIQSVKAVERRRAR